MPEKYDSVELNFRKQPFPQYFVTLHNLADALDANQLYNDNRPAHIHPGQRFRDHVATMKELSIGADRGDVLLKEQRQAVRDLSELDIHSSVSYMKTIAIHKKDPSILHTLNLPLKESHQKSSKRSQSPHQVEIRLELRRVRNESGAITIIGTHVRNGGPYLINLCKGEPTSEASWFNPGGHYNTCTKIVQRNLEPANKYYVRMRTDRPEGPGPWSQPVSIIVL
ncbi:hypothetical protein [Geomonas paludis]|uniref:Fibronectin type-III domain-containing protein n=1 Tax=Geomonas paludis TaxID=2740185 RepID=A0A6V8N1R3_9BACT|nr:hypothetical protein [Geomonas paludis]GFO66341.1 hypothetical protein GMPD_42600 [Geomonas paludis]